MKRGQPLHCQSCHWQWPGAEIQHCDSSSLVLAAPPGRRQRTWACMLYDTILPLVLLNLKAKCLPPTDLPAAWSVSWSLPVAPACCPARSPRWRGRASNPRLCTVGPPHCWRWPLRSEAESPHLCCFLKQEQQQTKDSHVEAENSFNRLLIPSVFLTLNSVSLPWIGDAIGVNQPVLPIQYILDHLLHCLIKKQFLPHIWSKDLQTRHMKNGFM